MNIVGHPHTTGAVKEHKVARKKTLKETANPQKLILKYPKMLYFRT